MAEGVAVGRRGDMVAGGWVITVVEPLELLFSVYVPGLELSRVLVLPFTVDSMWVETLPDPCILVVTLV